MIEAENLHVKGLLVEPKSNVATDIAKREAAMAALQYNTVVLLETATGVRITIDPVAMMATCKGDVIAQFRSVAGESITLLPLDSEPGFSATKGGIR